MLNLFLISRYVFFVTAALLVNLNFLILVFAAWSASSAAHSDLSVSVTIIFFILNSCALFIAVAFGMAEIVFPKMRTGRVVFECVWSALLSVFQTGTAISATINGAAICRLTNEWELCAASSLLVPVAWLSSMILFTYFLALFITAFFHVRLSPEIWTRSIYSIDWFNIRDDGFQCEKGILDPEIDTWARYMKDIEATPPRTDDSGMIKSAPWARTIRRGIDAPFKSRTPPVVDSTATPYPVAPLRIQSRSIAGSRFIERFRESARLSRPESISQMQVASQIRVAQFPPHVEDLDLPIPLPRLSEWVRAEDVEGITPYTLRFDDNAFS